MKRKEAVYKGLQFTPVWFEDTSLTSPDYFQITEFPTRLTAGKNLFKLRGQPSNLRVGGYLNTEILDYNGDPIYHEIVNYIDEDKSRVIAIYIYSETSPGDCTVTILAEAENVPEEWKGRPNVKWTRTVPVNPNISNVSEIIFETLPELVISEQIGTQLDRQYPNGIQFPTYTTGTVRYFLYNGQPALEITGGSFTGDMSTGTVTVTAPVNPSPTATYLPSTTTYTSTIKKILSPTLALLDTDYTVYSSQSISAHTYRTFDYSAFSLSYEASPTYIPTQNSESFALAQINGLNPATGDISRVKLFANNNGTVGTWELINDIELEETEIFVSSTASLYPDVSIGVFTSQSIIDTYWEGFAYQGKTTGTAPTLTWNTSSLNNAMQIQNNTNISARNSVTVAKIKSAYQGYFLGSAEYKVTLDALGTRTNSSDAVLAVYLSGSAVNYDTTDYFNQELPVKLGKRLGELRVSTNNQRFDDTVLSFETSNTGYGVLLLVVENGDWQVADIRTTTDNDSGYSPNYTRIRTLVPTAHKSDNQLSFKAEYYNVNGEKSKQITYAYNKNWEGGNRYVDGDYSMLTGSLYVADSLNSGVAISGYKNTGFIRSLGYEGFAAGLPGFLIWSGSALSGSAGTQGGVPYSGVGIELYANTASYFRYSTTDSEIDIRTDSFFFGQYPAPFISGANGNIQISASNFHLSPEGNVTASNALFTGVALANIIRDKTVTITTANSSSYLETYTVNSTFSQLAYRVVLDGTLGGEIVRRVRINCSLLYPIGTFKLPQLSSTAKLDITLETGQSDTEIYDVFTPTKSSGLPSAPTNTVLLTQNAAITFVAGGSAGSTWLTYAGTEHPLDHVFKSDVTISGSVILPNLTSVTTPNIIYYNTSTKTISYGPAVSGSISGSSITINNNTNNNIITATGLADTINGESNLTFDGSTLVVTGNVNANSFTGSLSGTASLALTASYFSGSISNAVSSSYAVTASYVQIAQTASYVLNAVSASYAPDTTFPYTGSAIISGSLNVTGSLHVSNSLDTLNKTLLYNNGSTSINWNVGIAYDDIGFGSIDWRDTRELLDTVESSSLNWGNRQLYDSLSNTPVDWENKLLRDSTGVESVDWTLRKLSDAGNEILNWDFSSNQYRVITSGYSLNELFLNTTVKDFAQIFNGTDPNYSGEAIKGYTADSAVNDGDLVALHADGLWYRANQSSTSASLMLGVCVSAGGGAVGKCTVVTEGSITVATSSGYTPSVPFISGSSFMGRSVYMTGSGGYTTTKPTSGYVRVLGHIYYYNAPVWLMKFRPSNDWYEI
jgi:hypothetical protein